MSDTSPSIEVLPTPASPRRGLRPLLAALAAVVLVGGTVVAVNALGSDGSSSTPDAPVRAMIADLAAGDVDGVLEHLVPGERDALEQPIADLFEQLERLGVLGRLDLGDVQAYKLKVDGLTLDTQSRRADLAFVKITGGDATYSFDPADLPLGSLLTSVLGIKTTSSPTSGSTPLGGDGGLVTVKRDGHWYVSLGYTLAEQARTESGASLDDLGQRVTAVGADTPEDAVRALIRSGAKLDLRSALATLSPAEMGPLQEYAGLFLPAAEKALADTADPPKITIDTLDLSSRRDGDNALVKIDEFAGTVVADGVTETIADGCVTITQPGQEPQRTCGDDPTSMLGDLGGMSGLGSLGGLGGLDQIGKGAVTGIRTVKVDGKWYVSPIRTVLDNFVDTLKAIQPGDLSGLAQTMQGLTDELQSGRGSAPAEEAPTAPTEATTTTVN